MPITKRIVPFNQRVTNPLLIRLAGRGTMVDLEHVGWRSGRTYHTPLMAFRHGDTVTVALTYGPDVQWLRNITEAGTCRMRLGPDLLVLGPPRFLDPDEGRARVKLPQRALLRWPIRCRHYIELPVVETLEPERRR